MSLPDSQQRILDGIATTLRAHDSGLASMFATFTRLTSHDAMPETEQLKPGGAWRGCRGGGRAEKSGAVARACPDRPHRGAERGRHRACFFFRSKLYSSCRLVWSRLGAQPRQYLPGGPLALPRARLARPPPGADRSRV